MGKSPSEGDIAAFFGVAGSSAHQMVVTLEKRGALSRSRGVARSLRVLVDAEELPVLGWGKSRFRNSQRSSSSSTSALLEFADFLAQRICRKQTMVLARIGPVSSLADRVCFELTNLEAPKKLMELIREYLLAMPWASERRTAPTNKEGRLAPSPEGERSSRKREAKRRRPPQGNPDQGFLFEDDQ